jgi:hypothetical protein
MKEEAASEFIIHEDFVSPLDVGPAFWLADAGVEEGKVFDLLHDFPDAIRVFVKRLPVSLKVPGVEGGLHEFLVACEPEIIFPWLDWEEEKEFQILVEVAPDKFLPVLHFFFAHSIPGIISLFDP